MSMVHQLLVYADAVNMLGGSVHTNAEALIVASKVIGIEINVVSTWSCLEIRMQDRVTV